MNAGGTLVAASPTDELEQGILACQKLLASADRPAALAEARRLVARFPAAAQSHRNLSYMLSHDDLYRYDVAFCNALLADGSIAEALESIRNAIRLDGADYNDYLQAGYCLTALKDFAEAAKLIRKATDMAAIEKKPGLFADMGENWTPVAPDFLIIGVKKGGTTSLHYYLTKHPRVLSPILKEIDYVASPQRGRDWYLAHFPRRPPWEKRFITGEARVDNFAAWNAPQNVRDHMPGVKLIAVLRDPVERAISHYYHDRKVGAERRTLDEAFAEELALLDCPPERFEEAVETYRQTQRNYIYLGLYARHLEKWLAAVPAKDLLIIISEELNANPKKDLARAFQHIGLKYQALGDYTNKLPGVYDKQSKDNVRSRLAAFFDRYNERLYELLGRRLAWRTAGEAPYAGPPAQEASAARVLELKKDWKGAAAQWSLCANTHADHPERDGWLAAAADCFRKAGAPDRAAEICEGLLLRRPDSPAGLSGLARAAQARRDWAQARAYWEECLLLFPTHAYFKHWLQEYADVISELGAWELAEEVFTRLVTEFPEATIGYTGLARAAFRRGDHERAAAQWEDCLARFPQDSGRKWWISEYATVLLAMGARERAEMVIEDLLKTSPDAGGVPGMMAQLARLFRQGGETQRAVEILGRCITLFPTHKDQRWWLQLQGDMLMELKHCEAARDMYVKCIAINPDTTGAYSGLTRALQQLDDIAGAAQTIETCIARFPANPDRKWWMPFHANLLCELGAWDRAAAIFEDVATEFADSPAGPSGLARVAIHRKDWDAAARLLQDCIDRFPANADNGWWAKALASSRAELAKAAAQAAAGMSPA